MRVRFFSPLYPRCFFSLSLSLSLSWLDTVLPKLEVQCGSLHTEQFFSAVFAADAPSGFVEDILDVPLLEFQESGGVRIEGGFSALAVIPCFVLPSDS